MENKEVENWDSFLAPYEQAVEELKVKLKGIRKQYRDENTHAPIEFITGRVKTKESILEKAEVRDIDLTRLEQDVQDIAGLRIMCQFVEDIHEVVRLLRARKDFKIIIERDYITHKKESGYRSYHMVIEYPVQRIYEEKKNTRRNSDQDISHEFLGNDRTFVELQISGRISGRIA